ncbi:receptor-type tyrosine-protein phosphatase eta [Chanos chanos]|uniref:protein-tyrosine-phosphatase n=1 Tax=Chanos chanos TaxID=29144 RepID=A0A6J2WYA4_CHACN|nr:receptor-type tyrosine-protein phosphatase eta-like [Chanos chanos]
MSATEKSQSLSLRGTTCVYKSVSSDTNITIITNSACTAENISAEYTGNSVIVTGLQPGNTYLLRINCSDLCCSNFSTTEIGKEVRVAKLAAERRIQRRVYLQSRRLHDTPASVQDTPPEEDAWPEPVSNLSFTQITNSSLFLSWTKGQGRSPFYRVTWKTPGSQPISRSTTETSIRITGLAPGTKYSFEVNSVAADNMTEGKTVDKSQNTVPAKPENIRADLQGNDSLTLSWDQPPGHVDKYKVQMSQRDLNVSESKNTNNNTSQFKDLSAGRLYDFTVTSVSGALESSSDLVRFATRTRYDITVATVSAHGLRSSRASLSVFTRPNQVRELKATATSTNSLRLEWLPPSDTQNNYTYRVQISPSSGSSGTVVSGNNFTVNGLRPGAQYTCSVTTVISNLSGPAESVPCYTKPETVRNLTATTINETVIRLTWLYQGDQNSTYYYKIIVVGQKTFNTTDTTVDVGNLTPGASYTFQVVVVANSVRSEPKETSGYTRVGKPSVTSAVGSTTNVTVTWSQPSGNVTSYNVTIRQGDYYQQTTESNGESVVFQNLKPGTNYSVTVISISGLSSVQSDEFRNATLPTRPGQIDVYPTNDSLILTVGQPYNMIPGEYTFLVSYGDSTTVIDMGQNRTRLSNLTTGTQYNIMVKTIGAKDYESDAVSASSYTLPNSATSLQLESFSTTSVTVTWVQADSKTGYQYNVTAQNQTWTQATQTLTTTTAHMQDLRSAREYNVTIVTLSAGGTSAPAVSITVFTKPYPVSSLGVTVLNVSAVKLNWTRPLDFPPDGSYRVETSACTDHSVNQTVTSEQIVIAGLESGRQCTFTVFSQANGIEGDSVSISSYTRPPVITPSVINIGSNDSLLVTWESPGGAVQTYILNISGSGLNQTLEVTNEQCSHNFTNLMAGTVYTVTMTSISGGFSEASEPVSNATSPNEPGPVRVSAKGTDFISVEWTTAQGMTPGTFNYSVTYEPSGLNRTQAITQSNTMQLTNLISGTSYTISVVTVGPMGFKSKPVTLQSITTNPGPVKDLGTSAISTDQVSLTWEAPAGPQTDYLYSVKVSGESFIMGKNTSSQDASVGSLSPGTAYNASVQAITSDGTSGALVSLSFCTDAAQVGSLTCEGPNLTSAMLIVSWNKPPGSNSGFTVQLSASSVNVTQNLNSYQHNFTGLQYYTQYSVDVWTRGCGKTSIATRKTCRTGITRPPEPNIEPAVVVSDTGYNQFTLKLDSILFNSSNGPVLYFGILVTSEMTGSARSSSSSVNQYLTKTYENWVAGETSTYLATVKQHQATDSQHTVVIGDETTWEGYKNGELNAKGTYSFAVVAFTNLKISNDLIATSQSFFSASRFYEAGVTLSENPVVIWGAVGGAVCAFLILFIATVVLAIVMKRRKSKEDSPGVPIHSIRAKVSQPIKVEHYESHYLKQRADSFCGFAEEFEDLKPVGVNQPKNSALAPENRPKNRYNNVLPYDSSRVKLSVLGSPFDDYINANYIPGYTSKKEFIAAQGPLPGTVNEFWRMIWEKNVHTVVMLTRCNEQGRVKCEEYWPAETKHFNNLVVTTTSEIPLEDWTIRDFDIKNVKTAETRSVRHFHFTAWPDHGVPETTELLINFRHLVREHMDQYSRHSPTLVHCSAGVGRTGTFIAIDRLIFQIERDGVVDVYGIIHDLRMHRPLMVQTEDQYVFLNQCAIDIIRSRTGTNVDLIYQNTAALTVYENFEPMKKSKNGYHKA